MALAGRRELAELFPRVGVFRGTASGIKIAARSVSMTGGGGRRAGESHVSVDSPIASAGS
jgi:hypothetical protein